MPAPLDGKFYGTIFRHRDNQIEPPDGWIAFVARDDALPATLRFYKEECNRLGAGMRQLSAVQKLIEKVDIWREDHPNQTKTPDV